MKKITSFLIGLLTAQNSSFANDQSQIIEKARCVEISYTLSPSNVAVLHANGKSCGEADVDVSKAPVPSLHQDLIVVIPPELAEGEFIDHRLNAHEVLRVTRTSRTDQADVRNSINTQVAILEFVTNLISTKAYAQSAPPSCNPKLVAEMARKDLLEGFGLFLGGLTVGLSFICPPAVTATGLLDFAAGASYVECIVNMPARVCRAYGDTKPVPPPPPEALILPKAVVDALAANPDITHIQVGDKRASVNRN